MFVGRSQNWMEGRKEGRNPSLNSCGIRESGLETSRDQWPKSHYGTNPGKTITGPRHPLGHHHWTYHKNCGHDNPRDCIWSLLQLPPITKMSCALSLLVCFQFQVWGWCSWWVVLGQLSNFQENWNVPGIFHFYNASSERTFLKHWKEI